MAAAKSKKCYEISVDLAWLMCSMCVSFNIIGADTIYCSYPLIQCICGQNLIVLSLRLPLQGLEKLSETYQPYQFVTYT
jgi:hypothetical protein